VRRPRHTEHPSDLTPHCALKPLAKTPNAGNGNGHDSSVSATGGVRFPLVGDIAIAWLSEREGTQLAPVS
jgi:hypothetical protein